MGNVVENAAERVQSITIADTDWKPTGDYDGLDPHSRMSATLVLNGVTMYAQGYEVDPNDEEQQHLLDRKTDTVLDELVGEAGFPVPTTTINDRHYIVIITPMS